MIRGTVTISGLIAARRRCARGRRGAAVIDGAADEATLQAISHVGSFSFKVAVAELVQHGILQSCGDRRWEFTPSANRDKVYGHPSAAPTEPGACGRRAGPPVETKRPLLKARSCGRAASERRSGRSCSGRGHCWRPAFRRWTVGRGHRDGQRGRARAKHRLLANVRDAADPALAGRSTPPHSGTQPVSSRRVVQAARSARIRPRARRIAPRAGASGTDSTHHCAGYHRNGQRSPSGGAAHRWIVRRVLGEESVDTRRARLWTISTGCCERFA
jgi:hypothetical protein